MVCTLRVHAMWGYGNGKGYGNGLGFYVLRGSLLTLFLPFYDLFLLYLVLYMSEFLQIPSCLARYVICVTSWCCSCAVELCLLPPPVI